MKFGYLGAIAVSIFCGQAVSAGDTMTVSNDDAARLVTAAKSTGYSLSIDDAKKVLSSQNLDKRAFLDLQLRQISAVAKTGASGTQFKVVEEKANHTIFSASSPDPPCGTELNEGVFPP